MLADRIALRQALKPSDPASDRVDVGSLASRRPLTRADIDAAVARAEERSKKANQSQQEQRQQRLRSTASSATGDTHF